MQADITIKPQFVVHINTELYPEGIRLQWSTIDWIDCDRAGNSRFLCNIFFGAPKNLQFRFVDKDNVPIKTFSHEALEEAYPKKFDAKVSKALVDFSITDEDNGSSLNFTPAGQIDICKETCDLSRGSITKTIDFSGILKGASRIADKKYPFPSEATITLKDANNHVYPGGYEEAEATSYATWIATPPAPTVSSFPVVPPPVAGVTAQQPSPVLPPVAGVSEIAPTPISVAATVTPTIEKTLARTGVESSASLAALALGLMAIGIGLVQVKRRRN